MGFSLESSGPLSNEIVSGRGILPVEHTAVSLDFKPGNSALLAAGPGIALQWEQVGHYAHHGLSIGCELPLHCFLLVLAVVPQFGSMDFLGMLPDFVCAQYRLATPETLVPILSVRMLESRSKIDRFGISFPHSIGVRLP